MDDHRSPMFSFDFLEYHVDFLAPNYLFFIQIVVVRAKTKTHTNTLYLEKMTTLDSPPPCPKKPMSHRFYRYKCLQDASSV